MTRTRTSIGSATIPPARHALTPDGRAALERELRLLRGERLPGITERLTEAREDSAARDEDAGLREILEEHSRLERRATEIEWLLSMARDVEPPHDGIAALGSRVEIDADGERDVFQLVDPCEADVTAGRLSIASPVGHALLGHAAHEEIVVHLPAGEMRLRIVSLA